jgi:hypothetical protein
MGLGLLAFRTVHPDRVPFGDIDWGSLLAGGWALVHSALERDRRVDVGPLVREEQVVGFLGFGVGEHEASAFDACFDAAGARDRLFHTAGVLLGPDRGARGDTEKESQQGDMRCSWVHVHPSPGVCLGGPLRGRRAVRRPLSRPSGVAPLLEATDLPRTFESQSAGSVNMRRLPLAATTRKKVALSTAAEK